MSLAFLVFKLFNIFCTSAGVVSLGKKTEYHDLLDSLETYYWVHLILLTNFEQHLQNNY